MPQITLREIRLHHWRQLMAARQVQKTVKNPKELEPVAMWHLGAVQCLNDYVPGTAEQDEANGIPTDTSIHLDDIRARAISGAGDLAELCARYAAFLERSLPQPGQTVEAGPETLRSLHERSERAKLVRELAVIFFRAGELERNKDGTRP